LQFVKIIFPLHLVRPEKIKQNTDNRRRSDTDSSGRGGVLGGMRLTECRGFESSYWSKQDGKVIRHKTIFFDLIIAVVYKRLFFAGMTYFIFYLVAHLVNLKLSK